MTGAAPNPGWWQTHRKLVADVMGYGSEQIVRLALIAIAGIVVARYRGPGGLGLLSFAGAVFGLVVPLSLLGLPQILVREFSTQEDWRPILASSLLTQLPVAVAASAIGFAVVALSRGFDRDALLLALVMLPMPILSAIQPVRSYLEATGRVRRIFVAGTVAGVAGAAWRVGGVVAGAPVWVFGAAATIELAVVGFMLLRALPAQPRLAGLRRHYQPDTSKKLLAEAWPLLLATVAVMVYMKADLLMLGIIAGDYETGIYSAAARLSEVWYFIPVAAATAIRPRLARMYASGHLDRYQTSMQQFMTALSALSLMAIAVVMVAADLIIRWIYGSDFLPAGPVLRIHILAAPFVFLGVAGSQWFIDRGMTRAVMIRSTVGAVLNVTLNLVLIPPFGATGASVASLCAYTVSWFLANATQSTRPLFALQARGLILRWPRIPDVNDSGDGPGMRLADGDQPDDSDDC
jgi:polysaccharide transporter, PST family